MRFANVCVCLALVACGGQSGNEGQLPGAPCSPASALVLGHIEEIGEGCVSVRVERGLAMGGAAFDARDPLDAGAKLRGYASVIYAWKHTFASGEEVAAIVGSRGDQVALELLQRNGERVTLQWGLKQFDVSLDELTADDCGQKLFERWQAEPNAFEPNRSSTTQTSPPAAEPVCEP